MAHIESENKIELAGEFLTQQMNHWMLFSLVLTVTGGVASYLPIEKPDILMWICCSVLPVLTFLVRSKVRPFFPFLLCNLAIAAFAFVLPAANTTSRVICAACGVGYFIHTFVVRLKADSVFTNPLPPAFGIVLSVFGVFFMHHVGDRNWDNYYIFTLIGCFALYLLIHYMNHFLEFLSVNRSSSGSIPTEEMFRSGFGLVAGYTFAGILLLVLSTNLTWLETIFSWLKKGVVAVIRFLISLVPEGTTEEISRAEEAVQENAMDEMAMAGGEASMFWKVLEILAVTAFYIAAVFFAVKLILKLYRYLKERFGLQFRRMKYGESAGDGALDIREKCEIKKESHAKEGRSPFLFLAPAERIRRQYKKKLLANEAVLADGEKEKLSLFTARESEARLGTSGMADIYERARYSKIEITAEDVKKMKAVCR